MQKGVVALIFSLLGIGTITAALVAGEDDTPKPGSGNKDDDPPKENHLSKLSDDELHTTLTETRKLERHLLAEKKRRGLDFSKPQDKQT